MALPLKALLIIAAFLIISALIVQTSASIVTKTKVPLSKSFKAIIYAFFFSVLSLIFLGSVGGPITIIAPIIVFLAQALAYSIALEVQFVGSILISILVMILGWVTMQVFGLSVSATLKLVS